MPSKHKNHKHKNHKTNTHSKTHTDSDMFTIDTDMVHVLNTVTNHINSNPIVNSYPYGNLGYTTQNPSYSAQVIRRPDDNKYFHNYKYNYNVQVNKPEMTYDNFIARQQLHNMTPEEYRYYQQFEQKYFYYNGNYEVSNQKPTVLAIQANLDCPMYTGGPAIGETNGQIGYAQSAQFAQSINPNSLIGLASGNVQIYGNSPAYTGIQAKTLPGSALIANINYNQTKANNADINNPAYFNYGQYYY